MNTSVMQTYGRYNVTFEKGEGSYLFDTDGRRYLDFGSGIAVNSVGHCHPHLVEALKKRFDSFYPEGNRKSEDYCRIVTKKHTERIVSLISKEKVVYGGEFDIEERYIAPTVRSKILNRRRNLVIFE